MISINIGRLALFGTSDINHFLRRVLSHVELSNKRAADIPAGAGQSSAFMADRGAKVDAYDIFPDFFKAEGLACTKADMTKPLPVEPGSYDYILCQEGIEHAADQVQMLKNFNVALCDGGKLIITTPSNSHLRARLANVFTEGESTKRMPANSYDGVWRSDAGDVYYGHIFLLTISRLNTLAECAGFRISKVHTVRASWTALLLAPLYPLIWLRSHMTLSRCLRKARKAGKLDQCEAIYRNTTYLTTHPTILFGRDLIVELEKVSRQL